MAATNLIFQVPDPNNDGKPLALVKEWLGVAPDATVAVTSTALTLRLRPYVKAQVTDYIQDQRAAASAATQRAARLAAVTEVGDSGL